MGQPRDQPRNALTAHLPLLIPGPQLPPRTSRSILYAWTVAHSTRTLPSAGAVQRDRELLPNALPQADIHDGPSQQPVLVRYGDHHRLPYHAVLAPYQLVGEAPRPLVGDEGSAVLLCLTLESVDTDRQLKGIRRLATTISRGLT
jgi:hypothetical protein